MAPSRHVGGSPRALLVGPGGAMKSPLHPLALPHTPFGRGPPPPAALLHRHAAPRSASPPPHLHCPPPPPPPPPPHHAHARPHAHAHGPPRRDRSAASLEMAASDQELMLRSWRRDGRAIALGAALGVLVLVLVAAAAALLGAGPGPRPPRDPFASMRDVLTGGFIPRHFNATWLPGGHLYFLDEHEQPTLMKMKKQGDAVFAYNLVNNETMEAIRKLVWAFAFIPSPDAKYILVKHDTHPMDPNTDTEMLLELVDVATQGLRAVEGPQGRRIQQVIWAPRGNAFAFVQRNDVFYVPSAGDQPLNVLRVTHDGEFGRIYNGLPSWSYKVEVFKDEPAMWFSPDGTYLAYGSFDESAVGTVVITEYFPTRRKGPYPNNITLRYPMPGTALPQASLWLLNAQAAVACGEAQPVRLVVPHELQGGERTALLGGARWATASELAAVWSNRVQDVLKVAVYNASTGALDEVAYSLAARDGGAVDLRARPLFSRDGLRAVLAEPLLGSAAFGSSAAAARPPAEDDAEGADAPAYDGPRLLLLRRRRDARAHTVLARGPIAVRAPLAWDEEAHRVYFLGSGRGEPGQQFLYSVPDSARGAPHAPRCESCALWMPHTRARACLFAGAAFPPDHPPRFFALSCLGPAVPESAIFAIPAANDTGPLERGPVLAWDAQPRLRARVAAVVLPWEARAELTLRRGRRARVRLWLPPNYDVAKAKYPLLLDMNEEWDGAQRSSERFNVDWRAHLAANRSVVYAVVAAGNGPPHKGIGQDDVDDQLEAIRELVERFNYIDAARVAVWGWSRGGYLAAMTMARDATRTVRCAIAVSPVVSWNHYHALYAERYLHLPTPDDNAAGYARADLTAHAEGFRGKRLLLIHGTHDLSVHLRHSLNLARELQQRDIPFEFQVYPDVGHGFATVWPHYYRKMERFLEECFPID